ncbi:MAG TPA: hydrogenase maturation protease [Gaiellaceae bacterium]|nr:hydrogenase maturation protease [Gaiellaceae bacterium]
MTCVIGVGNELRGDDAVGLAVVRALSGTVPEDVAVVECEGEPVSLLSAWEGHARAIVVDATQSGSEAGTIRRIVAQDGPLPPSLAGSSTHLLGLADAIELARALHRLPEVTVVYGIEGASFDTGTGLSAPVAAAAERVAAAIRHELEDGR